MTGIFGNLPASEVDRRHQASIAAYEEIKKEQFDNWYQELCDREYWQFGQRCSGCDFWASNAGRSGECQCGGKVPGQDVLRSMGISFSTYNPGPGYPHSKADDWCPNFKDEFDWSTLEPEYLIQIGAMRSGKLRDKPKKPNDRPERGILR